MAKMNIKKDDTVVVISGEDKGVKGKVLAAMPKANKVIVEKVNIATKHRKPRSQRDQGGIIKQEAPINASNVMLFCEKCGKPSRAAHKVLEDGKKIRVCVKCGETFDK